MPGVGQNIALHAFSAVGNFACPVHLPSFLPNPLQKCTGREHCLSYSSIARFIFIDWRWALLTWRYSKHGHLENIDWRWALLTSRSKWEEPCWHDGQSGKGKLALSHIFRTWLIRVFFFPVSFFQMPLSLQQNQERQHGNLFVFFLFFFFPLFQMPLSLQ